MENKEKLQSKTCDWCQPGANSGPDTLALVIGPGMFRDFDSDLSYGIPICGGCGGLGVQYPTEDFKKRTSRIMALRFKYCPTDPKEAENLTEDKKLKALEDLQKEVKDLVKTYGVSNNNSFAAKVSRGALSGRVEQHRNKIKAIEEARKTPAGGDKAALREASIAYIEGRVQTARNLFNEALSKFPKSSYAHHDYGVFLAEADNDLQGAYREFVMSTGLEPKLALHFFQAGKCAAMLGKYGEAIEWLEKASKQRDYRDFSREHGINAQELIQEIRKQLNTKQNGFSNPFIQ